jgi:hypothetical protein
MYKVRGYEYNQPTWKLIWLNTNTEFEISLNLALFPSGEKNKKIDKTDVVLEDSRKQHYVTKGTRSKNKYERRYRFWVGYKHSAALSINIKINSILWLKYTNIKVYFKL